MQTNIYTLPELNFVGGATQTFFIRAVQEDGDPIDLSEAQGVDFALCNYSDKTGEPIYCNTPEIVSDSEGVMSMIRVIIPAEETLQLVGKYIYQITVIDADGRYGIPNQGLLYIAANIHRSFYV